MKSHHSDFPAQQSVLKKQLAELRRAIEVSKILGAKPSKHQRMLLRLLELKIEWLTKSKLAQTKLMKYDKKIKRWTRKLNHENKE